MNNTLLYSYIDDIGKRLSEPNLYGSASVMIGAGFSKNAKYLGDNANTPPDWSELAGKMFDELYPKETNKDKEARNKLKIIECSGKNVLTLAEKYEIAFDRLKLNNLIERNIADKLYKPDNLHKKLLNLNWNDVFTTNYDTLLERTTNDITRGYKIIYAQDDLPGSVRPRIIKLHGSIAHSGDYIITEEDYRTYPLKYAPFVNTVQQSMLETRLCLIGFSGNDPNFLNWIGWLRDNMGGNCPQIYLCGLFDDMSIAERKMFENKKITVVDLSELVEQNTKNRYYSALEKFLDLLDDKSKKSKSSIVVDKSYITINRYEDLSKYKGYYDNMIDSTNKLIKEIEGYACLPSNIQNDIANYISKQFEAIINDKNETDKRFQLLGNICYILKAVNEPLFDKNAEELRKIINSCDVYDDQKLSSYINIIFYLLSMYRIDANYEKYMECIEKINNVNSSMNINHKNELNIELTKYYISKFDYDRALEKVEKIKDNSNIITEIKKACLLKQLNKTDEALALLGSSYASINEKKLCTDKKASIIGYINLCARSLISYRKNLDAFRDDEYFTNDYNCRKIIIESKDAIISELFNNQERQNLKEYAFNPNSYKLNYTMGSSAEEKKIKASFRYLQLQDSLCLPIYRDQKNSIITAIELIDHTSNSPLWKWYRILYTNDDNMINTYFTRERIYKTDIKYVEVFFDSLIKLWDKVINKEVLRNLDKFITEKNMVDILSRLLIVLDNKRISEFIHRLYQLNNCSDFERDIIVKAIERLKYSFNKAILEECFDDIFVKIHYIYHIASYFVDIECNDISVANIDKYIKSSIDELDSADIEIRDNAIAKIMLLNKIKTLSDYDNEISEKLWHDVANGDLPETNLWKPIIWSKLPHPKDYDFGKAYKKYILNPKFSRRVHGAITLDNYYVKAGIREYIGCFIRFTNINKFENEVSLSSNDLSKLIKYLYNYVNNEKSLLDNHSYLPGEARDAKEYFKDIGILTYLIYINGKLNHTWNEELENEFNIFIDLYRGISINLDDVNILRNIDTNNDYAFKEFESLILSSDNNAISIAFLILQVIIRVYENDDKIDLIDPLICDFISKLPYIEIEISKEVIRQMASIMDRDIFLSDENQGRIINSLYNCYSKYIKKIDSDGKSALDSMYNLSNLLEVYYKALLTKDKKPNKQFEELIEKFKQNRLNEIRMVWNK